MMIDSITEQRIKDTAKVHEVIGQFCDLKPKGKDYQCLCPFHDDHHLGSFSIDVRKNFYHCFACDAGGDSITFLREHEGMSYEEALRWLAKFYCIEISDNNNFTYQKPVKTVRPETPQLPMLVIDTDKYVTPTTKRGDNILTKWLKSLPWNEEQRERLDKMLKNYIIGTTKNGRPIFWQIDEKGICHTGKMIYYKENGKRLRDKDNKTLHPSWIHNWLMPEDKYDDTKQRFVRCLFGLHLLDFVKPKTVNIVESEKTVLIASTVWGNMKENLWMSIPNGKKSLNRELLKPIIDRKISIILYPDIDAIDDWKEIAKGINYSKLTIADRWMRDNWREEDGDKADVGDILIRIIKQKAFDFDPNMRMLADTLNLELLSIKKYD